MTGLPASVEKDKQEFEEAKKRLQERKDAELSADIRNVDDIKPEDGEPNDDIKVEKPKPEQTEQETKVKKPAEPEQGQEPPDIQTDDKIKASSPEKENDPAYWKSRFLSTAGELRKAKSETDSLKNGMDSLRNEIDSLKSKVGNANSQKTETDESISNADPKRISDNELRSWYTEDEIEAYDEDFLRMQLAKTNQIVDRKLSQIVDKKLNDIENSVQNFKQTSEERLFWDEVERHSSGAKQLQYNPTDEFIGWLEEEEGLYGKTRREIASDAILANRPDIVGKLFNAYKKEISPKGNPEPQKKQNENIEPHTTSSPDQSGNKGKTVYSERQVQKFYDDCLSGRYEPGERLKIEEQIKLAYAEGRVKP